MNMAFRYSGDVAYKANRASSRDEPIAKPPPWKLMIAGLAGLGVDDTLRPAPDAGSEEATLREREDAVPGRYTSSRILPFPECCSEVIESIQSV